MILVTSTAYSTYTSVGDPVSQAKIYEAQSADELILLNIQPTAKNKVSIIEIIRKLSEEIFMPITIGGGVSSLDDFRILLSNGADKVAVNTNAVLYPSLISEASAKYGAQCVVVSIDYMNCDGKSNVYIDGGKTKTDKSPIDWAIEAERLGAGEILITCINNDGRQRGLDVNLLKQICDKIKIPVIASGGCGLSSHFVDGFNAGASAVSAGTFFCFKDQNPMQTRSQINNAGIAIRLHK
jgi:imidazole glycerol-phosphate synthase subunit HisF